MPARIAAYPSATVSRYAIGLTLLAFSIMSVVVVAGFAASFLWPPDQLVPAKRNVNVGHVAQFRVNEPVLISVTKDGTVLRGAQNLPPEAVAPGALGHFWLVRLADDQFLALYWKEPHGCTVPWRPDFSFTDPATNQTRKGWFRDPCRSTTYDIQGRRVFGPAPRDMDRYAASVSGDNVFVKVGDGALIPGRASQNSGTLSPY